MGLVPTFCRIELPLIARVRIFGGLKTTGRKQAAKSKSCLPPAVSGSLYPIGKVCQKSIWQELTWFPGVQLRRVSLELRVSGLITATGSNNLVSSASLRQRSGAPES